MLLKFADDTNIFGTVSTSDIHTTLQDDLDKLCSWSNKWHMPFNVNKM